jgi:hypothetical protein
MDIIPRDIITRGEGLSHLIAILAGCRLEDLAF